jgi:hypothetical protein
MHGGIAQAFQHFLTSNEALAVLLAAFISFVSWLFVRALRPHVAWSESHRHAFVLPDPPKPSLTAYTKEIWVQNIGREYAPKVEVIFPVKPAHFDLWPLREYEVVDVAGQPFVIRLS